jgi:hypothetical protein
MNFPCNFYSKFYLLQKFQVKIKRSKITHKLFLAEIKIFKFLLINNTISIFLFVLETQYLPVAMCFIYIASNLSFLRLLVIFQLHLGLCL